MNVLEPSDKQRVGCRYSLKYEKGTNFLMKGLKKVKKGKNAREENTKHPIERMLLKRSRKGIKSNRYSMEIIRRRRPDQEKQAMEKTFKIPKKSFNNWSLVSNNIIPKKKSFRIIKRPEGKDKRDLKLQLKDKRSQSMKFKQIIEEKSKNIFYKNKISGEATRPSNRLNFPPRVPRRSKRLNSKKCVAAFKKNVNRFLKRPKKKERTSSINFIKPDESHDYQFIFKNEFEQNKSKTKSNIKNENFFYENSKSNERKCLVKNAKDKIAISNFECAEGKKDEGKPNSINGCAKNKNYAKKLNCFTSPLKLSNNDLQPTDRALRIVKLLRNPNTADLFRRIYIETEEEYDNFKKLKELLI